MPGDLYQDFVDSQAASSGPNAMAGDDIEVRLARARGKARAEGFADGAATAEATFDHELRARVDAVSEALSQYADERKAADTVSLTTVRKVIALAIDAFAPTLADTALPSLVAKTIEQALSTQSAGAVVVQSSADRLPDLQRILQGEDARLTFTEAPDITPGSARVLWRGGFDDIDALAAIKAGAALLDERLRAAAATNANAKKDTTS